MLALSPEFCFHVVIMATVLSVRVSTLLDEILRQRSMSRIFRLLEKTEESKLNLWMTGIAMLLIRARAKGFA